MEPSLRFLGLWEEALGSKPKDSILSSPTQAHNPVDLTGVYNRRLGSLDQHDLELWAIQEQYIISVPYLDAYSSICFPVMARIRERLLFFLLLVLFLNGIIATRGKAMLPTLPQKGAAFFSPKMPVPPSGPSKQQNFVPGLRFIPATEASQPRFGPPPMSICSKSFRKQFGTFTGLRLIDVHRGSGLSLDPIDMDWTSKYKSYLQGLQKAALVTEGVS
ncbi:hypothetical protein LguiA_035878 [Lonicera macranthoides]